MRGQHRGVVANRFGFLRAPGADGFGEHMVGDPVPAAHQRWQETTCEFMFALRAGFETGQSLAQAIVDALVIAGLEMQAGQLFACPQ